jgi:hypothetical protein
MISISDMKNILGGEDKQNYLGSTYTTIIVN